MVSIRGMRREMEKKAITGIILALILINILTLAFNATPIIAETGPAEFQMKENSKPLFFDEGKWNFDRIDEWVEFAKVDDDSVELVIGVNYAKPSSYTEIRRLITENGGKLVNTISMGGKIRAVVADIPLSVARYFARTVQTSKLSSYIEPNIKYQTFFVPNDPSWPKQWGPRKIEADYAWNTTVGNSSKLVAVIDTGIDYNHPDLDANYVPLGYDWYNNDADPMDDHGHGTHCAGIIAAEINNNIGIAGLAQVQIMAEKAFSSGGYGYADDIAQAIIHAVDQGADILSNSWGSKFYSELIHDAVKYAYDHGVLVVAAAGNDADSIKYYPAAYDEVVAVTATDEYDNPAWFTNFGYWVELAAPGVNIYSTVWDNSYKNMSGTSMACPHVSGVAALVWSTFPNKSRDWLRLWLRYTADDLGEPGFDYYYGYGRINARRAVEETSPDHDLLISNWEKPTYVETGTLATINATVLNFGSNDEVDITVELLVNGSVVDDATIDFLASGASATVSYSWVTSIYPAVYNVTLRVVPVNNEVIIENNIVSRYVFVGVKTMRVPVHFSTIHEAVDAAVDGFTILVSDGVYYETISVDKQLSLIGENRDTTVIDANGASIVVLVYADNVSITNFKIVNGAYGVYLVYTQGCNISNCYITNNNKGIFLYASSHNSIVGNSITNNNYGISLCPHVNSYYYEFVPSTYNIIFGNNITNNSYGIDICGYGLMGAITPGYNIISGNNVTNNGCGISLSGSSSNKFYHNNFIDNGCQVCNSVPPPANTWDDGYPSGGNYWSNYTGVDANGDGIGDTPYVIDASNKDNYPLINPYRAPVIETRYMRGDQHTVNGLTTYKLSTTQSNTAKSTSNGYMGPYGTVAWGIRVWIRHANGSQEELTNGLSATVTRSSNGEGIQSATWNCPYRLLAPTDVIVIKVYVRYGPYPESGSVSFITEQLNVSSLIPSTWTVYYYTKYYTDGRYSTTGYFYWGTSTYNSRIEGFTYTR